MIDLMTGAKHRADHLQLPAAEGGLRGGGARQRQGPGSQFNRKNVRE